MGRGPAALGSAWLECLSGNGRGRRACDPIRQREPVKEGKKRQKWSFVVPFVAHEAIQLAIGAEAMRARTTPAPMAARALRESGGSASQARGER